MAAHDRNMWRLGPKLRIFQFSILIPLIYPASSKFLHLLLPLPFFLHLLLSLVTSGTHRSFCLGPFALIFLESLLYLFAAQSECREVFLFCISTLEMHFVDLFKKSQLLLLKLLELPFSLLCFLFDILFVPLAGRVYSIQLLLPIFDILQFCLFGRHSHIASPLPLLSPNGSLSLLNERLVLFRNAFHLSCFV